MIARYRGSIAAEVPLTAGSATPLAGE
jgi:hypothetical protein